MQLILTKRRMKRQQAAIHDLLSDLKSCSRKRDLQEGKQVHKNAKEAGNDSNMYVAASLINMYAKCRSMVEAHSVFDNMKEPHVMYWNALILGYADNGKGDDALDLFSRMKANRICLPNSRTYVAAIKACTSLGVHGDGSRKRECLERGREIHLQIGCHSSPFIQSALINMYAKLGSMGEAQQVFDAIEDPNVVSYTALVVGYADNGQGKAALNVFSRMKVACGCVLDSVTYIAAIKACTSLAVVGDVTINRECLKQGRDIHMQIGHHMNHILQNTLINMYSKCGSMVDAQRVFDSVQPDVVSWTTVIMGYVENGKAQSALELFSKMKAAGKCIPDSKTYIAAIKACTSLAADGDEAGKGECLKQGREIHSEIGYHMDHFVASTLINMYATCSSMVDARRVFDSIRDPNVVSWTALIMGYADNGEGQAALDLFSRMKADSDSGCAPDSMTYVAAIKAVTSLTANGNEDECLKRGKELHLEIGNHLSHFVQNTLVNMYVKCGSMTEARLVFDSIEKPDVVSWSALILGYANNGEGEVALDFFSRMKTVCAPDSVTYVSALKACASIGALAIGRKFHSEITDFNVLVVTGLVDFYAKCGSMIDAREVFDSHSKARNIATWNALLAGYGSFGDIGSVFNLFEVMQDQGFRPDVVTFVCMLSCCSHGGLVEKAREYLEAMPVQYGITPTMMHYNCMIDVYGRANQLDEAVALLQKLPCNPDAVTWTALSSRTIPLGLNLNVRI